MGDRVEVRFIAEVIEIDDGSSVYPYLVEANGHLATTTIGQEWFSKEHVTKIELPESEEQKAINELREEVKVLELYIDFLKKRCK